MKVKDLIEILQEADPELEVFCTSNTGEHEYCLVNTARDMELTIDDNGAETILRTVFVIAEE